MMSYPTRRHRIAAGLPAEAWGREEVQRKVDGRPPQGEGDAA